MKKVVLTVCIAGAMLACTACKSSSQPETTIEQQTQAEVSLTELCDAVKNAYGDDYLPSEQYDKETFEQVFGLTSDQYEEFFAETSMMSVHVDTFVAVKAKEGKAEEVEQVLHTYYDNQLNNALQYPMNLGKVEGARIYRNGDYVFYMILGGYPAENDVDTETAKKQNQVAVDAIEEMIGKADQ